MGAVVKPRLRNTSPPLGTSDSETLRHPFSRGAHRWVPPVSARRVSARRGSTVDIGAEDCLRVGSRGGCLGGLSRGVVSRRESQGGLSRDMSRGVVSGRVSRGWGVARQGWAAFCKKKIPSEKRGRGKTAGACANTGQKREPQTEPGLLLMSGSQVHVHKISCPHKVWNLEKFINFHKGVC
jgi:hypothetical protein